jgi:hypothetical protein
MLDHSGALRPSGTASEEARVRVRTGLAKAGVTSSGTARRWNQADIFIEGRTVGLVLIGCR